MKNIIIITVHLLVMGCAVKHPTKPSSQFSNHQLILSQPITISTEQAVFHGSENLLQVPENRNEPSGRLLALHFFRFEAKQKTDLPPVIFLGAGPGEPYDVVHFSESEYGNRAKSWVWELAFVNQKRDLILINQRGNPNAPGLPLDSFAFKYKNGEQDQPFDWNLRNKNRAHALEEYIKSFQETDVDIKGYSILEMVEDIESIRKLYNDPKLALIGTSFGSQWALAYMRQYPQNVDRAILSGLEPLDRNHDKPSDRWRVMTKIADYAAADPSIAPYLPEGGLINAYQTIIEKLEKGPVDVKLNVPAEDLNETILIGLDDFRMGYRNPYARGRLESINSWPKYITEIYQGDMRTLALRSIGRGGNSNSLALSALVDKSLGGNEEWVNQVNQDPASRWLGPINGYLDEFMKIEPNMDVGDEFRQQQKNKIPLIMIQGDMDLNTPIENAYYLQPFFSQNHLITVKRGTHTAKRAFILSDSELASDVYQFMNLDFNKTSFKDFKATLPDTYELPSFEFWPITGESLFDKYTQE